MILGHLENDFLELGQRVAVSRMSEAIFPEDSIHNRCLWALVPMGAEHVIRLFRRGHAS